MLRTDPLTERVVVTVTEHAHLVQHLHHPMHRPEGGPVRDDDPSRGEVNRP